MSTELVLVVGDMFVPQRCPDISPQFKSLLIPNKIQHVLCLGNIGSNESYDWLKSLSNDFHCVKGDFDENDYPEKELIKIGEFNIGIIHGHQIFPWGDINSLGSIQRELGCDILIYGHTHQLNIKVNDNILYLNPGSISGAFSPEIKDNNASFILIVIQGEEVIIYCYIMDEKENKFVVNKMEYKKGGNEIKQIENEEE